MTFRFDNFSQGNATGVEKFVFTKKRDWVLLLKVCAGPVMLFWELRMLTGPKKDDCTQAAPQSIPIAQLWTTIFVFVQKV